jgi:hypothetical protein
MVYVDTPRLVKSTLDNHPVADTTQLTFDAPYYGHVLRRINSPNNSIDNLLDSAFTGAYQLPTVEISSIDILVNTSKLGISYYMYKKDGNTYVVTSEKTFLHKKYELASRLANDFSVNHVFLLATHRTSSTNIDTTGLTFEAKGSLIFRDMYMAIYKNTSGAVIFTAPTDIFPMGPPPNTPTPLPATVSRQTTGDGLQPPNGSENSAKQQTPPDRIIPPNTPTPLPQNQYQMPQTVSATTLATTPCTGPYERAINTYNTHVLKAPIMGKPIACSTAATEAKTKLTVTITPSVPIAPGSVTFKDVPMEKKDDAWFGFMMIAPTASSSQWIQLEVKEQKLSYTACLGQCDATSPKYEQKKDLEVKRDKDKKYKFEGGTVEYTEEDPFHKGNLALILGVTIGGSILGFILLVVIALFVFNRGSVAKGVSTVATHMSDARDNALMRLRSWGGNSNTYSQMDSPVVDVSR